MSRPSFDEVIILFARVRLRCRQFRLARWLVIAGLAGFAALSVGNAQATAEAAAAAWGTTTEWPRSHTALPAGHRLLTEDFSMVPVPVGFAPSGRPPTDLVGELVLVPVSAGELLTRDRFATGDGVGALLPAGHRGVAVPVELVGLPLAFGDRVDVIAAPLSTDLVAVPGEVIVQHALVVEVGEDALVISVPVDAVVPAATAIARRSVAVVLSGGTTSAPDESAPTD